MMSKHGVHPILLTFFQLKYPSMTLIFLQSIVLKILHISVNIAPDIVGISKPLPIELQMPFSMKKKWL